MNTELSEAIDTLDMATWLDREGISFKETRGVRGAQLNIKECPFCGGAHYKVYMNAENGLGNCFSGDCEKKFSKWKFIRAYLGHCSAHEVVDHIIAAAREQGWRPPRMHAVATSLGELKLPESVALPHGERNLKYLDCRGIGADISRYFGLRFSLHGKFEYQDERGRKLAQDYSRRVIIPVYDLGGNLVSFQGRDTTGTSEKKYLFPPGFASTGAHLYNGQNATGAEHIVIGEGAFDVMATKIALDGDMALRDVVPVGSFGKHLSFGDENSQMGKLLALREGGLKVITFMWDAEPQAINDAISAALLCRQMGFIARVALLPAGLDPNEVAPDVVRRAFYRAETITMATATKLRMAHIIP